MQHFMNRTGMCVLTFHRVVEHCEFDYDITWGSFRRLLDTVAASGDPVDTRLTSEESIQRRAIALTFDDGTEDHARVGEELAARGIRGIFFVPASAMGMSGRLSGRSIRELHSLRHVIGSHGFSLGPLHEGMSREDFDRELRESKTLLEDTAGGTVSYFAPPGGVRCRLAARELPKYGYEASRCMKWGIYASLRGRWDIPCILVTEFVLARGWVMHALRTRAVPFGMRFVSLIKPAVPGPVRFRLRKLLHDPFRMSDNRLRGPSA